MEKENRIPLPRRRPGSDGPAPTAITTSAQDASDDGPAASDARLGQEEEGRTGGGRAAGQGGMGSGEARPGLAGAGASPGLPRRVRGMSDGPRPPAQVARPALPASFLERVRAAAEAEQRLEERAQEPAGSPPSRPPRDPGHRAGRHASSGAATGWAGTRTRRTGPEVTSPGRGRRAGPRVTRPGRPGRRWLPPTSGLPAEVRNQTRRGGPTARVSWAGTAPARARPGPRSPLRRLVRSLIRRLAGGPVRRLNCPGEQARSPVRRLNCPGGSRPRVIAGIRRRPSRWRW